MTKISVIIPTMNEGKYLEKTLDSIKNQNFKNYEIIISDSGSKDETLDIAQKHGAKILIGPKEGPGVGRNLGAKHAKGDILFFLDADTIIDSRDAFEKINDVIYKEYIGGSLKTRSHGKKKHKFTFFAFDMLTKIGYLLKKPLTPGYCTFVRKDVFDRIGGYDKDIEMIEDVEMMWRAMKKTKGRVKYLGTAKVITSPRRFEHGSFFGTNKFYIDAFIHLLLTNKVPKSKFEFKPASEIEKGF